MDFDDAVSSDFDNESKEESDETEKKQDLNNDSSDFKNCPILKCLPEKLFQRLLPFQKKGVQFAVEKDGK